jgi:hypothetical protein
MFTLGRGAAPLGVTKKPMISTQLIKSTWSSTSISDLSKIVSLLIHPASSVSPLEKYEQGNKSVEMCFLYFFTQYILDILHSIPYNLFKSSFI